MKYTTDGIEEAFLEANPYAALSDEAATASRSAIYEALKRRRGQQTRADSGTVILTETMLQNVNVRK